MFCVFNQHYQMFLTDESIPAVRLFAEMARRTRLLFSDWVKRWRLSRYYRSACRLSRQKVIERMHMPRVTIAL